MSNSGSVTGPHVVAFDFDGGLVLLDERRGCLFVYEGNAASLWNALAAGVSTEEVRSAAGPAAAVHVDAWFAQWRSDGLLSDCGTGPAARPDGCDTHSASPETATSWHSRIGSCRIAFSAEPEMARMLQRMLGVTSVEADPIEARISIQSSGSETLICRDGVELIRTDDEGLARGAIYQACLDLLHDAPQWRALIHGAAVARDGRAIGLPAPSGSGKTTLTAWLAARGFDYLADDLLAVLDDGRVAPWPLPISVKAGSVAVLADIWPELAGATPMVVAGKTVRLIDPPAASWRQLPVPLAMLVFPRFDRAGDGIPRRLRPLHALARLASDRIWLGFPLDRELVGGFLAWLETMPSWTLDYADLAAAEHALAAMLAEEPALC